MRKIILRWLFSVWFVIALFFYFTFHSTTGEESEFINFSIITFIIYFPAVLIGELHWLIGKFVPAFYIIGGLFALSIDLLRLHIKKYREYKRIALQARMSKEPSMP